METCYVNFTKFLRKRLTKAAYCSGSFTELNRRITFYKRKFSTQQFIVLVLLHQTKTSHCWKKLNLFWSRFQSSYNSIACKVIFLREKLLIIWYCWKFIVVKIDCFCYILNLCVKVCYCGFAQKNLSFTLTKPFHINIVWLQF